MAMGATYNIASVIAGISPATATAAIRHWGPRTGLVWVGGMVAACAVCTVFFIGLPISLCGQHVVGLKASECAIDTDKIDAHAEEARTLLAKDDTE